MDGETIQTASGLEYVEIAEGKGAHPKTGESVSVHYTGWLKSGQKFDSSLDRGQPLRLLSLEAEAAGGRPRLNNGFVGYPFNRTGTTRCAARTRWPASGPAQCRPQARGHSPSLERLPANRPWRAPDLGSSG